MLTFQLEDVLLLVVVWLVCGLVSAVVFMRFVTMRYAGEAVIASLKDPNEEVREAIAALMGMVLACEVPTGRMIEDDKGKEVPETVPMVQYIGREAYRVMTLKLRGAKGGAVTNLQNELMADPAIGAALSLVGPRKGQSTGEFLMEQMMLRMSPAIEQKVAGMLNNVQKDTLVNSTM